MVMGVTEEGSNVVGLVSSIDINGQEVMLNLESGDKLPLANASIINKDTATFLIGQSVEGNVFDEAALSYLDEIDWIPILIY